MRSSKLFLILSIMVIGALLVWRRIGHGHH